MKTALVALILLTGCSLAPSDKVLEAMAANQRSYCLSVTTIYGRGTFGGSGIHGGSVTCSQDGLTVKSDAAQVGVPLTVTPQLSIGAPTLVQPPR